MLDAEECLHLALHASSVGNHHACMTYLKEGLQQQPRNARAIYLLAAQHAELGLLERAIGGMQSAISIEPSLEIARFQLGLLLLDRKRPLEALEQFKALDTSADRALRACSEAMAAVARGDLPVARAKLAEAVSLPSSNPALLTVVRRLLDVLPDGNAVASGKAEPQQVDLGAYRQLPKR